MVRIAIVEDEAGCRRQLQEYIRRFSSERGVEFDIAEFQEGSALVEHYRPVWDIILLDIQMPGMDGMETARRIREYDQNVVLVFITNLAQFAIKGYEVSAYDFVVKPITYPAFAMKLQKITVRMEGRAEDYVLLPVSSGMKKLAASEIFYIEVINHRLYCHTAEGPCPLTSGTLTALEEKLTGNFFCRCNSCYLVNLRYVTDIRKDSVVVGGDELAVSRARKKPFLQALTEFVGG